MTFRSMYERTDMECKQDKERYGLATAQGDVYIFWTFYTGKEFRQIIPNTAAAFTIIDTVHMSYSTLCMKFLHRSFQADWFGSNKMD